MTGAIGVKLWKINAGRHFMAVWGICRKWENYNYFNL